MVSPRDLLRIAVPPTHPHGQAVLRNGAQSAGLAPENEKGIWCGLTPSECRKPALGRHRPRLFADAETCYPPITKAKWIIGWLAGVPSFGATASLALVVAASLCRGAAASPPEVLVYHPIQTDADGNILPWYDQDPGKSYDHVLGLVWQFWDRMRMDPNGLPYYMNHQVWNPDFDDPRGIGGDQLAMALSSWRLYYAYTGNERVKANMAFIADYYLSHGLSPADSKWPDLPFPYNTLVYSGVYDGDMRAGKDVTQPDKAGSSGTSSCTSTR